MKNKLLIAGIVLILAIAGIIGYKFLINKQAEQRGEAKFRQAISEIRSENPNPGFINPCLGHEVTRRHSYQDLDKKTVDEIKVMAQGPSLC